MEDAGVRVVIGLIYDGEKNLLISLRPDEVFLGGYWEFPGGKVEQAEGPYQALCRELYEEVGIEVNDAAHLLDYQHQYDEQLIHFSVWEVKDYHKTPSGKEGQTIKWIKQQQLNDFRFPKGNQPIIDLITRHRCEFY